MSNHRQDVERYRARFLAMASLAETGNGNAERGLLLALEALREPPGDPEPEAVAALTAARAQRRSAGTLTRYEFGASIFAAFSATGDRVASISWAGIGRISDVAIGCDVATFRRTVSTNFTPGAAVAFSADGAYVSFAWNDGTICVWDAATGAEIATLDTDAEGVSKLAIGASGTRLLCTAGGAEACLWDLAARSPRAALRGHEGRISHVAFSGNGQFLATASEDGTARVYECRSGALVAVLAGHVGKVGHITFSPDGGRIVTTSSDMTARIWSLKSSANPIVLRGHEASVCSGGFSPDQRLVVTTSHDATARLWDAETGVQTIVLRGHENRVLGASFNPAGPHVVTRSDDGTARLWDGTAGTQLAVLTDEWQARMGEERPVHTAAFSPDGRLIVTTSNDGTVRLWHTEPAVEVTVLRGHLADLRNAAFSPDEQRVVTASRDGTARLWDARTGSQLAVLRGHTWPLIRAEFSPDGGRVLTQAFDGTPRLWDSATGEEIAVLLSETGVSSSPIFSADGAWVSAQTEEGTAPIWDATSGRRVITLRGHQGVVWHVAFSPDGSRILTASVDRTARIWDVASGGTRAVMRGHTGPITKAVFSPDGERVLTVSGDGGGLIESADGTARLWDAGTGAELAVLRARGTIFDGDEANISDAAFSPDGERVVTLTWSGGAIGLWDAATGRAITEFEGEPARATLPVFSADGARIVAAATRRTKILDSKTGDVLALAHEGEAQTPVCFSPDGTRFLSVSDDGSMQLHDALTGAVLAEFRGHAAPVSTAAFSRDGTRILTSSYDKTARIWGADPIRHSVEYLRATLCREVTREERTQFHLADASVRDRELEPSDADPTDAYVRRCDEAIADPDDPMRTVEGVPATRVRGMLGVATCRYALSLRPDVTRLRYQLGRALEFSGQPNEARREYEAAAAVGYSAAQVALARMLLGEAPGGDERSPEVVSEALALLQRAAEAGNQRAMIDLGRLYLDDTRIPRNASRGLHWLGRAAALGDPRAHEMLAERYERGLDVPLDLERAYVHWGIAARRTFGDDDGTRSIRARERQGMLGRTLRPAVVVARWQEVRDWQPSP